MRENRRSMSTRTTMALLAISAALVVFTGCPNENNLENNTAVSTPIQQLPVDFDQETVISTSVLTFQLRGTERIVARSVLVDFDGQLDGSAPFRWSYSAATDDLMAMEGPADAPGSIGGLTRTDGDTGEILVGIPVADGLWGAVAPSPDREFTGSIKITVVNFFGEVTAESTLDQVKLSFKGTLAPQVAQIPGVEVYLDERVQIAGAGFLRPEEGTTYAVVEQGKITHREDQSERDLSGKRIALAWDGSRSSARFRVDPTVVGVREGTFSGNVRFINELRDGTVIDGNLQEQLTLDIQQSFISTLACGDLDPCPGGARGQRIEIRGRGLVDTRDSVRMTLRFDGLFTPDDPNEDPFDFTGPNALERSPDRYIDDQGVELAVWYSVINDGGRPFLTGLGAVRGTFDGTITPILTDDFGGTQEGFAWQGAFRVLPTRQVVYLKYLPRFSRGLEKYGLRNVENEIRAKIMEVAQAPYKDFNVIFVDEPPQDFVDYATIELSGPDPYGRNAFGYDNSFNDVAKDTDNLYLADYIGGWSQGSAEEFDNPFGGIYIESFDYFSYRISAEKNDGTPVTDASQDFDRILGPFMPALDGSPVRGTEWPDGSRAAEIEEAIHMVGSVIGNTVAHEVGHSMGMAFEPTDRFSPGTRFHNANGSADDGALMDSGNARPFDERANINGVAPATFNQTNARYLGEILPRSN